MPPVEQHVGKGRSRPKRVTSYADPRPGLGRRILSRLLSASVLIPLGLVTLIVLAVLVYYWTIFSKRIDNLLAGEVFTSSAGIYAAPKQLRAGETISQEALISYLKRAGYVEKTQQAETSRGAHHAAGDLTAVGDQHAVEHAAAHIRNVP